MKIHVGSGTVFLRGYVNVDLPGPSTFLAADRPDLVEKLITDEADYYGRHADKNQTSLRSGPLNQEMVCDRYGSFANLPARPGSAVEILTRHAFEHLSIGEARTALSHMREVLQPHGVLRIDVPDHEATLQLFRETGDDFYIRHLLGPRSSEYGFHMMSYDLPRLKRLVEDHGFRSIQVEANVHFYPAFCVRFEKRD